MLSVVPFIFLIILNTSLSTVVKWVPNTNFNLASNFKDGRLPCSNETLIFPNTLSSAVVIEGDKSFSGIVLPNDGTIFLPQDGVITLERDGSADGCKGGDAYYLDVDEWSWAQPDVWSSPTFNEATPDTERVPCYDDIVEFPKNARFTIQFPDTTQRVRGVKVNGALVNLGVFEMYLKMSRLRSSPRQSFVLNNDFAIGIKINEKPCYTRSGCPCQENPLKIICEKKYCKPIECLNPIKPVGHCCNICGGSLAFDADDTFDITEFRSFVEKYVNENGGHDKLAYHVGKLTDRRVQLVVVEKSHYESDSAAVVGAVDAHLGRRWTVGDKQKHMSGVPLSMTGLSWRIALGTCVLVTLIMVGLYLGFHQNIPLPRYPIMRAWRAGGPNIGVITRFQGRTESVVSLTPRDLPPYADAAQEPTAFRNPLYQSKREPGRRIQQIEEIDTADDN